MAVAVHHRGLDQPSRRRRRKPPFSCSWRRQLTWTWRSAWGAELPELTPARLAAGRCLLAVAVHHRGLDQASRRRRRKSPFSCSWRRQLTWTWRSAWGAELPELTPARLAVGGCLLAVAVHHRGLDQPSRRRRRKPPFSCSWRRQLTWTWRSAWGAEL